MLDCVTLLLNICQALQLRFKPSVTPDGLLPNNNERNYTMAQTLIVKIKNVYGTELVYPVNETAQHFLKLTGKKTFGMHDIVNIKKLGYDIKEEGAIL